MLDLIFLGRLHLSTFIFSVFLKKGQQVEIIIACKQLAKNENKNQKIDVQINEYNNQMNRINGKIICFHFIYDLVSGNIKKSIPFHLYLEYFVDPL